MLFHIGLENNMEGRSIAWVLGHPGCFANGVDGAAALEAAPQAIRNYIAWIAARTSTSWLAGNDVEIQLEEAWDCYSINDEFELVKDGYEVDAWFRHDWKPLSAEELENILTEYGEERWSRRIARAIVEERNRGPIETTQELRKIMTEDYETASAIAVKIGLHK